MVPFFSGKNKLNPVLSGREYLEESDDEEDSFGDRRSRRRGKRYFLPRPSFQAKDDLQ